MTNPEIDYKKVFGDGFYNLTLGAAGKPCTPIPCTPEDHAYRQGAEAMRKVILEGFEALFDDDACRCYRRLRAAITEVEW